MKRQTRSRLARGKCCLYALAGFFLAFRPASGAEDASSKPPARIDYNRDIRPIFSDNCYACHGPDKDKRKAGLRLDLKQDAFKKLESNAFALVPGDPGKSKLIELITTDNDEDRMPPPKTGKRLTKIQVELLRRWIEEGATWTGHWAYLSPERPALPKVKDEAAVRNEIDYFILARQEKEGLQLVPEADRTTLLRRASLDLTGLPPTIEEVDGFLADKSPAAYEKAVDRLLAAPQYGERMALSWLDLARYADTSGYHFDGTREMWLWREWVIQSFNQNKPFDEFTIEQLAGDLLPNPTISQKIATGFHRNVMTTDEGGADPQEYLTKYVVDRVATTASVWLGSTMNCAECHDHKYDPITQKDFYQFYAFFHNVPEKGLDGTRTSNPAPSLKVPSPGQAARLAEFDQAIPEAERLVKTRESELGAAQARWEKEFAVAGAKPREPEGLLLAFPLDGTFAGLDRNGSKKEAAFKGTNAPVWGTGKLHRALKLDGQNGNYLDAGQAVAFDRTNSFSYGCWTKVKGKGGAILSKMEEGPSYRGFDLLAEEGKLVVHLVHAWPDNAIKVATSSPVPKDAWFHALVTYDGSSKAGGLKVYLNGKSQGLEVKADNLSATLVNQVPLHIGKRFQSLPYFGNLEEVRFYGRALSAEEAQNLAAVPILALVSVPAEKRTEEQAAELKKYFRENHARDLKKAEEELAKLSGAKDDFYKKVPSTMVMEEMEKPRDTFMLIRGNFQNKGDKVTAGVPHFLPPLAEGLPGNRLGLARWLVAPNHPLTSRVTVNRFWQLFFGAGLVKTLNDFGSQGEWPSHPELLDWLATEFLASGWDVKHMVKLIVMSATYRQSAAVTPNLLERDPYNRLLTRGPRLRLEAEFLRDNALAVGGLLNRRIGGESVKPYQPPGLWELTDRTYDQSKGSDLYRRGIYTYWKRAVPYPAFITFDAPNRETCAVQRPHTSTPLQSLVLMNDPVFVEAARGLAQRVLKEGGPDFKERLSYAFRLTLARPPQPNELQVLTEAYHEQLRNFTEDKEAAAALISIGETPKPKDVVSAELAAWTAVGNVLLNLNEALTK